MGAVWTMTRKDLLRHARRRTILLFGVVAPLVLAGALSLAFGDVDEGVRVHLGLAGGAAGDPLATALRADVLPGLVRDGVLDDVSELGDRAAAVAAVDAGDVDAALVVTPSGLEVVGDGDRGTAADVAAAIAAQVAVESRVAGATLAAAAAAGVTTDPATLLAAAADTRGPVLVDEPVGVAPLDAVTATAAGISVFFLFFAVGIAVTGLLEERRDGTLARLRASPTPTWAPLAATALLAVLVGTGSMVVLVAATTLLLGADWGPPGPLLLVVVAGVLAATGVVGLVAAVARTEESASSINGVVGTLLGALGGAFFPIASGGLLGAVAALTPHQWFLRGVRGVAGGASSSALVAPVLVLLGMAAVTGGLAVLRLRATEGA